jgi:hypothetical protein
MQGKQIHILFINFNTLADLLILLNIYLKLNNATYCWSTTIFSSFRVIQD